jgi:DNA-binding transcriptional LysR family regulator
LSHAREQAAQGHFVEIRHLKYMLAVADEKHFHLAAKRLHIAQPALSQNIRQLEEEIGTPLFKRTTRRVELTNAGRVFYQQAMELLRDLQSLPRNTMRASLGTTGSITVGFTETALFGPFRELLHEFHEKYPEVSIQTRECAPTALFERLLDGSIDIACNENCVTSANHAAVQLPESDVVVALHKSHPLATESKPIPLSQLQDQYFIFPTQNSSWSVYELFARALAEAGILPRHEYWVENAVSGISLVAAGLGVCMVPDFVKILPEEVVYRVVLPRLKLKPQIVWLKANTMPITANFAAMASEYTQRVNAGRRKRKPASR